MSGHVLTAREGALLTIRMHRPEKKNALTRAICGAMAAALRDAARLATRAVPDDEVEPAALVLANRLAALPPGRVRETKRLLRAPHAAALRAAMAAERRAFRGRLSSGKAQAAFAAFLSRKA